MLAQTVLAALLVAACAIYAVWALLPGAARRPIARALLRIRWPQRLATRLQRHAEASDGCACDGCDQQTQSAGPQSTEHPIRLHRSPPASRR